MVGGPAVEGGVEVELDRVALDVAVAPAEGGHRSHRVVADRSEVEVLVVPEDAEGGVDAGGLSLVRVHLRKGVFERGGLPGRLVHPAVDPDRRPDATRRVGGAHERGLGGKLGSGPRALGESRGRSQRQERQRIAHPRAENARAADAFHVVGHNRGAGVVVSVTAWRNWFQRSPAKARRPPRCCGTDGARSPCAPASRPGGGGHCRFRRRPVQCRTATRPCRRPLFQRNDDQAPERT